MWYHIVWYRTVVYYVVKGGVVEGRGFKGGVTGGTLGSLGDYGERIGTTAGCSLLGGSCDLFGLVAYF